MSTHDDAPNHDPDALKDAPDATLIDHAEAALEDGDVEGALVIADLLRARNHPASFELIALAHSEDDEDDEALKVAQEGTEAHPDAWRLWHLTGNLLADDDRFDEAHAAYTTALGCPDVDVDAVRLSVAVAYEGDDRFDEALATLDALDAPEPDVRFEAVSLRLDIYNAQNDFDATAALAQSIIDQAPDEDDPDFDPDDEDPSVPPDELVAHCHASLGLVSWLRDKDAEATLGHAWNAIDLERGESLALWLIRQAEDKRSEQAHLFKLSLEGSWPETFSPDVGQLGFRVQYFVVADSSDDALELARRFEPEPVRDSLWITNVDQLQARPEQLLGVYRISSYLFFPTNERD